MKKGFKKFLTVLLAVAMICTFSVTAFAAEGGSDNSNDYTIVNHVKMFKPATAKVVTADGKDTLQLTFESGRTSYNKFFIGTKADAEKASDDKIVTPVDGVFNIPVTDIVGKYVTVSVYTKDWYERTMMVSKDDKTLYFIPVEKEVSILENVKTPEEAAAVAAGIATPEVVDKLIEAIYVQARNEKTDIYCAAAKAAWDALSEEDQEKVEEGDYFGADTGDASKDDPLNQDNIGKKEILVVSFGTSFNDSRVATIGGVEKAVAKAFPEYSVRRAFTAQIIINHIQARDGEVIDNMEQAMDRAVANGVEELILQPTHLMHGYEYDEMKEIADKYKDKIASITISEPLLNTDTDKKAVAEAIANAAAKDGGFDSVKDAADKGVAFVFMGHGTSHDAKSTYTDMQAVYDAAGMTNVFIGTVEGEPESTSLPEVKKAVEKAGFKQVVLRPLMVVAGDHANNDMAADEEGTWYYGFAKGGEMEVEGAEQPVNVGKGFGEANVTAQIAGLGEIEAVQKIYVSHLCDILGHSFKDVVTKATDKKAGKIENTCEKCGTVKSTKTIYKASKISLSKTAYTYDSKLKKPVVTVKDSKGNKIAKSNYGVSYKNNKKVGKATVTITLKGKYKGTVKKTFKINPKGTSLTLKAGKKSFKATVKKQSVQTTGYQIRYSAKSSMANAKTVTIAKNTTLSKTVKNLKAGKKYYVQVRTYKTVNKVKYTSNWSKPKAVTTK